MEQRALSVTTDNKVDVTYRPLTSRHLPLSSYAKQHIHNESAGSENTQNVQNSVKTA